MIVNIWIQGECLRTFHTGFKQSFCKKAQPNTPKMTASLPSGHHAQRCISQQPVIILCGLEASFSENRHGPGVSWVTCVITIHRTTEKAVSLASLCLLTLPSASLTRGGLWVGRLAILCPRVTNQWICSTVNHQCLLYSVSSKCSKPFQARIGTKGREQKNSHIWNQFILENHAKVTRHEEFSFALNRGKGWTQEGSQQGWILSFLSLAPFCGSHLYTRLYHRPHYHCSEKLFFLRSH